MAVAIRLRREGALNRPYFKVVVTDKRSPRDGKFIEIVGTYDPKKGGMNSTLKLERTEAIVLSMTSEERTRPEILNARRRQRIARGSGSTVTEVNDLIRRFDQMKKMMKNAGKMKKMMAQMARMKK